MSQGKPISEISQVVEKLASTIDIEELATRLGLSIKRVGGTASTLCISHNEENPSMRLFKGSSSDKPHYHCFVCGAHGDIFTLVQKVRGLNFVEAVKWLASAYGLSHIAPVKISKVAFSEKSIRRPTEAISSSTLEKALSIYRSNNSTILNQWLEHRKLSARILERGELGVTVRNILVSHATAPGNYGKSRELLGQLESAGLIRTQYTDANSTSTAHLDIGAKYRDFFYDTRIVFPIRDVTNLLVGFAARKTDDSSSLPKYLYSPGLKKSQVLYRAREAINKIAELTKNGEPPILYICEGLLDALRLESFGLAAVAVLGSRASESQANIIYQISKALPEITPLQVRVFLDKDSAGLKGAASTIKALLKIDMDRRLELAFVWPSSGQATEEREAKDPDELLKETIESTSAKKLLDDSSHSAAVALIADRLNIYPEEVLDDDAWDNLPYGPKSRSLNFLKTISDNETTRVLNFWSSSGATESKWLKDIKNFSRTEYVLSVSSRPLLSPNELTTRLNHARELAQTGANKGEVFSDIATWRRLALAATAFNEGLISRLKENHFKPVEPFDAVHVSRGFGKREERLKAMPCPEDLIMQQYVMNELLSESLDNDGQIKFSDHIPAVRYYRGSDTLRTTGETPGVEKLDTLSFAYQIDMDALEMRTPHTKEGMFRPYFECWQGFISSLLSQGQRMDHVHMIRLDLKRYYDNIKRSTVKDALIKAIIPAYEGLEQQEYFVPLFQPSDAMEQRHNAIIDYLLDQSFGFTYYHPDSGIPIKTNREIGIPQGPTLSAWIGNILLFKLDAVLREKLQELNQDGNIKSGYARYVDDVVILGDSLDIVDVLRASVEDVSNSLGLEMVSKESFAPMSTEEFSNHLTSGRAIAASGPREEQSLFEAGDGDAGWELWHTNEVNRQASLELLRDSRLYSLSPDTIENQVFTALRAKDLRPAELSKAARWVWYQTAVKVKNNSAEKIFIEYWSTWNKVCDGAPFNLNSELPWDDPAFYAIEGLEALLERANHTSQNSNPEEDSLRKSSISNLAQAACSDEFIKLFLQPAMSGAPEGWAKGTVNLRRMIFQRLICMQWKAVQLSDRLDLRQNTPSLIIDRIVNNKQSLQASLKRALITHMETWKIEITELASNEYDTKNSIVGAFAWLHKAIALLSNPKSVSQRDPLDSLREELDYISGSSTQDDKLIPLLQGILVPRDQHSESAPGEILLLSLQTIAAISPRESLPSLLASRPHLLQEGEAKLPLPPLPGIPANGLLLCSNDGDREWTKLSKIWWVTVSQGNSSSASVPEFRVSFPDKPAALYVPDWKSTQFGGLSIYEAKWEYSEIAWALITPVTFKVNANNLCWVADVFESIARLNHPSECENSNEGIEYPAAWPYLVVSTRPGTQDASSLELSLLSPPYQSGALDGVAYIKDGTRGLRTYDVPELYAQHWRAGVLLSELFGYRRDLDQFASLGADQVECDVNEALFPADHLLRNVLRKLRGNYAKGALLKSYDASEHLPASISRSLDLLRNFPNNGDVRHEIAFVLMSESETAAMQIRLNNNSQLDQQGVTCAFFEKIAVRVTNQIPLSWAVELNKESHLTLDTKRSVPRLYYDLALRIQSLVPFRDKAQPVGLSFSVLLAGLKIASVTSWIREIAFSIHALDLDRGFPLPSDGDLAEEWGIEEQGFFFSAPENSLSDLSDFFIRHISESSAPQNYLDITPLGWTALVAGRIGLLGEQHKRPLQAIIPEEIKQSIQTICNLFLFASIVESDLRGSMHSDWPFELNHIEIVNKWIDLDIKLVADGLVGVEKCLGIQVKQAVGPWRLDATNGSFTDTAGDSWKIRRWQLYIAHGNKPERVEIGTRLLSVWDETSDHNSNLLYVSALGERFRKLSDLTAEPEHNCGAEELGEITTIAPLLLPAEILAQTQEAQTPAPLSIQTKPKSHTTNGSSGPSPIIVPPAPGFGQSWRDLQSQSWSLRKSRSPGHTRIAVLQWEVDETYHHPATEVNNWDEKWSPQKSLLSMEESNREGRRRKFIAEALHACESFEVDILVLPEYSVRPDTVKWLRERLKRRANSPAVLAGTYKLHGNRSDANFDSVHGEILGYSDHLKTFNSYVTTRPQGHSSSYLSGEHSAMMTLLAPLTLTSGERIVCNFSRRKKYSSLAASEVFSPLLEELRPLFSAENLIQEIGARTIDDLRAIAGIELTPQLFLQYYNKLGALDNIAEFICSELFLPMSPVNYKSLAAELHKLALRFGGSVTSQASAEENLLADLKSMAEYLGIAVSKGKRKSIVVVPAMTTRSADYWVFGQATLLSGGATTVFCNAVKNKLAIGGSCFIGKNSWVKERKSPIVDKITPYAGWSKGIYYNQPTDALGDQEQAIIIADIDPSFMQEGRPRPQALAIPLQLVSYIPIIEVQDERAGTFKNTIGPLISNILENSYLGQIVDPNSSDFFKLNSIVNEYLNGRDKGAFSQRFNHWVNYWRANPLAGTPPAVIDWTWIDSTSETNPPAIFVPQSQHS